MPNVQSISPCDTPFATPSIGDTEPQQTLPVGPIGLVKSGGVPWHKRLALTKAPSPTAHHVMLVLGSFVSDGQSDAWPSVATLASMTGLTRRTVQRALRALEEEQLVQTETVSGRSSRYRLASTCVTVTPLPASQLRPPCVTVTPEGAKEVVKGRKAAASERRKYVQPGEIAKPAPLPVLSESQETETNKPDRHVCQTCGNDWPAKFGTKCFTCQGSVKKPGRLTVEYGDRFRSVHPEAGAVPEPNKYDCLFQDDAPRPGPPKMAPETVADLEALALARGFRKTAAGKWTKAW